MSSSIDKKSVSQKRSEKQSAILNAAEEQFALHGFNGVSLESIASSIGMTRHSLLYYYSTKEQLYVAVLDRVLELWLEDMNSISVGDDPEQALSQYIAVKMRFSHDQPSGSKVFTQEVSAGAPYYRGAIEQRVKPVLERDLHTLKTWAEQGKIQNIDFMHMMFLIWSATQAYADLAPQFALLMGKEKMALDDYDNAAKLLTQWVLLSLKLAK